MIQPFSFISAFTPLSLPGLAAWYSADFGVLSQVGRATQFTSANSQALSVASNSSLVASGDFTINLWLKWGNGATCRLFQKGFGTSVGGEFELYLNSANHLVNCRVRNAENSNHIDMAFNPGASANVWEQYVLVGRAGVSVKAYKNGTLSGTTATASGFFVGTNPIRLGSSESAHYLEGAMDEVAFWQRALTDEEITFLYNSGAGRTYQEAPDSLKTNLVSWWSMNAPASGDWLDQHGTNHLTPSVSRPTATEGVTFEEATDGQTVRRWLDRSGNGRHLEQSVLANQPVLNTSGYNGRPAVAGAGTQWLFTSAFSIPQPFTAYQALRCDATGNRLWSFGDTLRESRYFTGPVLAINAGTEINVINPLLVSANAAIAWVLNGVSSSYRKGSSTESISPGSNSLEGYAIMARINGFGPTASTFTEHAIYAGAHSSTQQNQMLTYLASKWGITL